MLDRVQLFGVSRRLLMLMASLAVLSGCANNVIVKADIPTPLVEKLPITGTMVYTERFKNYVYLEAEKKRRSLKSLDIAAAQISLFDRVFGSLMTLVGVEEPNKDLTIEPEILDFQYSAPGETKLKQYEVWIKYRLKLSNQDNQKLADWTIKGYGKTPTGLLTSASSAFNSAATVALRDVGAQLSLRFAKQRTIKQLLAGDTPQVISEPEVEPEPEPEVEPTPKPTLDSAQAVEPAVTGAGESTADEPDTVEPNADEVNDET